MGGGNSKFNQNQEFLDIQSIVVEVSVHRQLLY